MNGIAVLLLTALLILGSAGWGLLFQVQLKKIHKITSSALALSYLQIPIGISLFLLVFSWLVALGICSMWCVLLWHFLGVTMLAVNYIFSKGWKRRPSNWSISLINTTNLVVCSLASLGVVASRTFQKMDDLPAYAYLAQKLVATGGLIDPFSSRRILSYGGATLYQAVFVKFTGLQSIFAFDNLFIPIVLVITLLLYCRSHNLSPWLLGLLSLCLVAGTSSLILFNLSPRFAITFFTLVVLLASFDLARSNSRVGFDYVLVMGLLVASLSTMRVENAVAPAIVVLLTIVWDQRSVFRHALLLVGIGMLSVSGWAFALYRSSGTFLFPIMRGTANMSFYFDPVHWDVSRYCSLLWSGITQQNQSAVIVAVVVASLGSFSSIIKNAVISKILLFTFTGTIVEIVLMLAGMKGFDGDTLARYVGPTLLGVGVFTALLLFVKNKEHVYMVEGSYNFVERTGLIGKRNIFNVCGVVLVFLCCFGYVAPYSAYAVNRTSIPFLSTQFRSSLSSFWLYLGEGVRTTVKTQETVNSYVVDFSTLNSVIPIHSEVLSAIEAPGFLDMKKFTVQTLDWPGAVAVPLNGTVTAFMGYLRQVHVNYLLVQNDYNGTLYDPAVAHKLITGEYNYSSIGNSVLHWNTVLKSVLADNSYIKKSYGQYTLISVN